MCTHRCGRELEAVVLGCEGGEGASYQPGEAGGSWGRGSRLPERTQECQVVAAVPGTWGVTLAPRRPSAPNHSLPTERLQLSKRSWPRGHLLGWEGSMRSKFHFCKGFLNLSTQLQEEEAQA